MAKGFNSFLALNIISLSGLFSMTSRAEDYMPDYEHTRECQKSKSGAVEICILNKGLTFQRIEVHYDGYLKNAAELELYLYINGKDAVFPMTKSSTASVWLVEIGKSHSYLCWTIDNDLPLEEQMPKDSRYPLCTHHALSFTAFGPRGLVYESEPLKKEDAHILSATLSASGFPVEWQIQAGFTTPADGKWDNQSGANYRFVFE
jgi:hypothetical protein